MYLQHVPDLHEIELQQAQSCLRLTWADGHISTLPLWYVRAYCPCAQCQGHSGQWSFIDADNNPVVTDILEVGHYALNIVFQGGHRTGIYSFEILRTLCPCATCKQEMGPLHPALRMPESAPTLA